MTWLKQWLPVILWAGLILSSANDHFSAQETGGLLHSLFGDVPHFVHVIVRKLAHVAGYGILAALTWRADRRWGLIIGIALLVAVADESMQSRSATRSGTPWDVVLDVAAAVATGFVLRRYRSRSSYTAAKS